MQVMILAAGRSTRLGALGAVKPKPLVPICGYPAISFGLASCARAGLRDVVINLHHHAEQIRAAVGRRVGSFGLRVQYSMEEDLLGTGGGIALARPLFRPGPLLVVNGKVVADLSLEAVIAAHRAAPRGTLATMVLRPNPNPGKFAPVTRGRGGAGGGTARAARAGDRVRAQSPTRCSPACTSWSRPCWIGCRVGVSDILGDAYQPALEDGGRVHSLLMTGYFEEHSTPARYLAGNLALLRRPGWWPARLAR